MPKKTDPEAEVVVRIFSKEGLSTRGTVRNLKEHNFGIGQPTMSGSIRNDGKERTAVQVGRVPSPK